MSITVRELVTKFGFKADLNEAKKIDSTVLSLKKTLLGTAAVGAAAAASIFGLANSVSKAGDEIAKTAPTIGLGTTAYQEYMHAANLAGLSNSEFSVSIRFLSRNVGDLKKELDGAGTASQTVKDAFDLLKVSVVDSNGKLKSNDALLLDMADAFQTVEDSATKTKIAMDIFGRSGARMANLLSQGRGAVLAARGELAEMGAVLSPEELRSSEEYVDAMTRLKTAVLGIKNTVGAGILPELTGMVDSVREWVVINGKLLRQRVAEFVKGLVTLMRPFLAVTTGVADALVRVVDALGGFERVARFAAIAASVLIGALVVQQVVMFGNAILGAVVAMRSMIALQGGLAALKVALVTLGNTAFVTWLKVLGPYALIAVAIAALILLIQDAYTWIKGGDSYFRDWFGSWGGAVTKMGDALGELLEWFRAWFDFFFGTGSLDRVVDWGKAMAESIKNAFSSAMDFLRGIVSDTIGLLNSIPGVDIKLPDNIPAPGRRPFGPQLPSIPKHLPTILPLGVSAIPGAGLFGAPITIPPEALASPGVRGGGGVRKVEQRIDVNSRSTVVVPEGTRAEQATEIRRQVDESVDAAWNERVQQAASNFPEEE